MFYSSKSNFIGNPYPEAINFRLGMYFYFFNYNPSLIYDHGLLAC